MLQDPISAGALVVAAGVNLLTVLFLLLKLPRVDYPVPTHYLSLVGFDQVGSWYQNYRLAAFSILVLAINSALAATSFQRNRLASFFLLIGSVVVAILALVISVAFVEIV